MEFRKYMHIEKFGTTEVDGIELGRCYVFPKIDGTNSSVWQGAFNIAAGSRTRELTVDKDNAGFYQWVINNDSLKRLIYDMPALVVYGEWLVPHSLKTYKETAWKDFYVFDVWDISTGKYMPYEEYQKIMELYNISYIPPIAIITNPSEDQLYYQLQNNIFLIEDGKGKGEGIVIKNYDFVNKFGRTTWAKIVTSEFKEKNAKPMGAPEMSGAKMVEYEIAEKYVTLHLCEKVYNKIENEKGWTSKCIPQLLNTVYYDLLREDSWNFVKEHKNPTINYNTLMGFTFMKVKEHLPKLF